MMLKGPAPLTGALIVRKGDAAPAGYIGARGAVVQAVSGMQLHRPERPPTMPNPASIRRRAAHAAAHGSASGGGGHERARITLRLDPQRHLRLKLAGAHLDRSLQDILTAALDAYLDHLGATVVGGRCICLADGVASATD